MVTFLNDFCPSYRQPVFFKQCFFKQTPTALGVHIKIFKKIVCRKKKPGWPKFQLSEYISEMGPKSKEGKPKMKKLARGSVGC